MQNGTTPADVGLEQATAPNRQEAARPLGVQELMMSNLRLPDAEVNRPRRIRDVLWFAGGVMVSTTVQPMAKGLGYEDFIVCLTSTAVSWAVTQVWISYAATGTISSLATVALLVVAIRMGMVPPGGRLEGPASQKESMPEIVAPEPAVEIQSPKGRSLWDALRPRSAP